MNIPQTAERQSQRRLLPSIATLILTFVLAGLSIWPVKGDESREKRGVPNIVVMLADDMGYGDLQCYGHPLIRTPRIDALAAQGIRFTSFVAAPWCVPSRTQLLTGRYMARIDFKGATGSDGKGGLPDAEWTAAEALHDAGYRTHMIGKWHLGYKQKKFLPVHQGFDTWFGLPYSNDYTKPWVQTNEPLGLYRGDAMVEHPFDQDTLTVRYTAEAVKIINDQPSESADRRPFFLYLAYAMPHLPIHVSKERRGKSHAGLYGDVIEEVDWSVGQVLDALEKKGIADNTLVVFASDNGPWINMPPRMQQAGNELWHAGSAGPLRGAKADTYEGGTRVPAIVRWPARIKPKQVSDELVAMLDVYRTLLAVAGAKLPKHQLDGYDLTPLLSGEVEHSPRSEYWYFMNKLEALRSGDWKLRTTTGKSELFNLATDPGERINRAEKEPKKVAELLARMQQIAKEVGVAIAGK
jgi:arylsulfatase A-like enzyme